MDADARRQRIEVRQLICGQAHLGRPGILLHALDATRAGNGCDPRLLKVEYIHRNQVATRAEARLKIATWITDFYNPRRRHSGAAGLPPIEFERTISEARAEHHQKDQAA
ncbi:IS3 family transposase [Streptomyces sp. NPDC005356]|uniref:IS3 family transposase n=1 Tax=Streptomyces sp. NPDC005356 TaxID=3157167 RepID=UPI0033A08ACD